MTNRLAAIFLPVIFSLVFTAFGVLDHRLWRFGAFWLTGVVTGYMARLLGEKKPVAEAKAAGTQEKE